MRGTDVLCPARVVPQRQPEKSCGVLPLTWSGQLSRARQHPDHVEIMPARCDVLGWTCRDGAVAVGQMRCIGDHVHPAELGIQLRWHDGTLLDSHTESE